MNGLTRDRTTEPVSRDQILRREQEQGSTRFPCSADREDNWQPYPVDPYSVESDDDHIYILIVGEPLFLVGSLNRLKRRVQCVCRDVLKMDTTLKFGLK